MKSVSPILLTSVRFFIAACITLIGCRSFSLRKLPLRWALLLGLLFALAISLQNISLSLVSTGRGAFIAYSYALFIPPLQYLLLRKPINPINTLGIILALIGVGILSFQSSNGSFSIAWGEIAMIASSCVFPFYIIYLDRLPPIENFPLFMSCVFFIISLANLPFVFLFETPRFSPSLRGMLWLGYLASIGTAISLSIQFNFQNKTTPVRATAIYALEPVFAALIAFFIGAQIMTLQELLGAALVMFGVLVIEFLPWFITKRKRT